MEKENIIETKSYDFAIQIIGLYQYLCNEKKEYALSKQILRSGTSVGANIEEAIGGLSKKDFFAKLGIAYKEARETQYWLRLLRDTNYINTEQSQPLLDKIEEIIRIITAIQKTTKNNL
ncbi:four helix bundle protein [Limibacterium fermenti]|uniref:four helix bundle protein n=1 Tax=Limibacterium fermenti TaxID=3229863 RepID=UPI000E954B55|nr:four helix bundle protein [Porphyromonadaceae bacterium]